MADLELSIAGRSYRVACRDGEEATLTAAAVLVDSKSREALAGLGVLSESRQLLFAALLLADQLLEKHAGDPVALPDPEVAAKVVRLAERLEAIAETLEKSA